MKEVEWDGNLYRSITELARKKGVKYEKMQRVVSQLNIHSDEAWEAYKAAKKTWKRERGDAKPRSRPPVERPPLVSSHYSDFIKWLDEVGMP